MQGNILEIEAAGTLSDTAGPEASTGAVGCASVKGRTDERNVELRVAGKTWVVRKAAECGYAREDGVGLQESKSVLHGVVSSCRCVLACRHHQEACCTTVPREDHSEGLGHDRDLRAQLQ